MLFTLFLAGCNHDGSLCKSLEQQLVSAPDLAACEVILDQRMAMETALWPVYQGICMPAGPVLSQRSFPAWWPDRPVLQASR